MIVSEQRLLEFMGMPDVQFVIPVYQRVYSWTERQCEELWADLQRAGSTGKAHFIGTILYIEEDGQDAPTRRLDLIDGQQRMATLTLLLLAFRNASRDGKVKVAGVTADDIDARFLHGHDGETPTPKLLLSRSDRNTLAALVDGGELPDEDELSTYLTDNLAFFERQLARPGVAADVWTGLQGLRAQHA